MRRLILAVLALGLLWLVYLTGDAFEKAQRLIPELPSLNSTSLLQRKLKLDSWVSLGEISAPARDAIVASEDDGFFQNDGYELQSIKESVKADLTHLRYKRGASTITQQVMKNVFLTPRKTILRKLEELILAREAEKITSKDRILEVYLNTAQFGAGIYGIKDAAEFYFKKPPLQLTAKEGGFLAMLLPSPIRYAASFEDRRLTPYAAKTIHALLQRMEREGELAPGQSEMEMATPLSFEGNGVPPEPAPTPTVLAAPSPLPTQVVSPTPQLSRLEPPCQTPYT
jgi:monofunctional glycosyltransferase